MTGLAVCVPRTWGERPARAAARAAGAAARAAASVVATGCAIGDRTRVDARHWLCAMRAAGAALGHRTGRVLHAVDAVPVVTHAITAACKATAAAAAMHVIALGVDTLSGAFEI